MEHGIFRIITGVARVIGVERRRRHIEAAAPELHLLLPVFRGGLAFIESLERAVVPLVKTPAAHDRDPHEVHLLQHDPERLDRPLQHRSKCHIEGEPSFAQKASRLPGLLDAFFRERHIGPARETVFPVPCAFAVPEQNEFFHRYSSSAGFRRKVDDLHSVVGFRMIG